MQFQYEKDLPDHAPDWVRETLRHFRWAFSGLHVTPEADDGGRLHWHSVDLYVASGVILDDGGYPNSIGVCSMDQVYAALDNIRPCPGFQACGRLQHAEPTPEQLAAIHAWRAGMAWRKRALAADIRRLAERIETGGLT